MIAVCSTFLRVIWTFLAMRLISIIPLLGIALLRFLHRLIGFWPIICAAGAALGSVALLWRVRDTPLELGAYVRIDAVSAFFGVVMLSGLALAVALAQSPRPPLFKRAIGASAILLLIFSTTLTPAIAGGYVLFALVARAPGPPAALRLPRFSRGALLLVSRRAVAAAPWPLAATCLLLGYGTLTFRGALLYTNPVAGAALNSFVFWFVLLAALIPLVPFRTRDTRPPLEQTLLSWFGAQALTIAWCYPLVRLYSLGPWNLGWSFATLLLAGALAGWCAVSALTEPDRPSRTTRLIVSYLGMALAGIGLGTSAGIAATCFCMLAILLLGAGIFGDLFEQQQVAPSNHPPGTSLIAWLLAGVFPFTAPFVAIWMLIGASVAAGVPLLAGVAWLVALLNGLTITLWGMARPIRPRNARALAALSIALGVGAPLIVRVLIQPVVAQLQGGLTSYGDVAIWPWIGLAANDAGHIQVTTLPSIAIALLMLVLAALVYLVVRLRDTYAGVQPAQPDDHEVPAAGPPRLRDELLRNLRDDVPWLGALIGTTTQPEDSSRERE
jgi:hypothetical protein